MSVLANANQRFADALLNFFIRILDKAQEDEEGQDFLEYAVIGGVIAAAVIGLVYRYGAKLAQWWHKLLSHM